jgi:hypothetical protein
LFAGHLAVALVAKRAEPRVSLGGYVAAAYGLDLVWPVLVLAGIERVSIQPGITAFNALAFDSYPWSHSLLMAAVWSALAGILAARVTRSHRAGWAVGIVVSSHWFLDLIVHRPDLPLWPAGPLAGFGLWNSVSGTMAVEGILFAAGIVLYTGATWPRDGIGRWALVTLLLFVGGLWAVQPFSPPPPSAQAVALTALSLVLLPLWAQWADRHRRDAVPAHTR